MWHRPGYVPGEPVTTHVAELVWEPLLARLIPARAGDKAVLARQSTARAVRISPPGLRLTYRSLFAKKSTSSTYQLVISPARGESTNRLARFPRRYMRRVQLHARLPRVRCA
ncbi:hypothetical protein ACU19_04055 [Actinobaculum suis]|nr:hypothetical protein ACU19_04055 [Actinobaculum suis]